MNKRKYVIDGVELHLSQEQIQELVRQSEVKVRLYFKPENNQPYYYVDDMGNNSCVSIGYTDYTDIDEEINKPDNFRMGQGNCFETQEEVEDYRKYLETMGRIRMAVLEANEGWRPDWSNENEWKYTFCYNVLSNKDWNAISENYAPNLEDTIFCKTLDIANQILESNKSDFDIIANYLYNPKENDK